MIKIEHYSNGLVVISTDEYVGSMSEETYKKILEDDKDVEEIYSVDS